MDMNNVTKAGDGIKEMAMDAYLWHGRGIGVFARHRLVI